jgi:hypothetical protein
MKSVKSLGRHQDPDARFVQLAELLRQTPSGKLEEKVDDLLTHLPPEDVRKALIELIKRTSEDEFLEIKTVYLKHFGSTFH